MSKDVTLLEEIAEQDLSQVFGGMKLFTIEVDDRELASIMLPGEVCAILP
jgi:hypothetical protein